MVKREIRKQQITARRQEQILNAALDAFSLKGYAAATIPDIARAAGVAAGTIYLYYPGKRDLFMAVIENHMITPLLRIFSQDSDNFTATLKGALEDRFLILQNNFLPRLLPMLGEIQTDPQLRKLFYEKLIQPFLTRMEEFYRPRIASGELRSLEPAVVVRLMASLMMGMGLLKSIERESSPFNTIPSDQVVQEILNFVLYGILNNRTEVRK